MQTGRTYTENRLASLYGIAQENGRKKETARKRTRDRTRIQIVQTNRGLSSSLALVPLTSHLAEGSVNRTASPPTCHFAPHPPPEPDSQTSHQAAVTSEISSDGGLIQRAAAMRVTRVATVSSDAKTDPGQQQVGPNLSADSPFRARSYADFITDMELQQAKAEVEECYRRRAWRAGLGDALPEGRPMMEEELDDLRWQLGDFRPAGGYGSRGQKRRKEPTEMTIEEMEAEIEETNEAITKRRRNNLSLFQTIYWHLVVLHTILK
jgi:hypothetical protein